MNLAISEFDPHRKRIINLCNSIDLRDYLLGGDWNSSISSHPAQVNQVNTETILDIMANVPSAKYRRYPWWKKLYINIICLLTSTPKYYYY